ncbi:MAG: zinc ribbon domain-containing protein [Actinobacteria bacterium]|nr:zinc ribbon domain-containing protein [Actinomycetota bacterium]
MKFCPNCGRDEDNPQASFCRNCGAGLVDAPREYQEQEATRSAIPDTGQPVVGGGMNITTLILSVLVGILSVVIVVMALFLTVWSEDKASSEACQDEVFLTDSGPEELALEMVRSLEEEDGGAFISCFEKGYLDKMRKEATGPLVETVQDMEVEEILGFIFEVADFEITGLELETDSRGPDSAAVTAVDGELEIVISEEYLQDNDLDAEDMTVDFSQVPLTFEMERKNGIWYIVKEPFRELSDELML